MYCRKCGAQIDDEAYVCVHCGTMVKELPSESENSIEPNLEHGYRKTNGFAIAGFVLSFFGGILGLIFSIIGRNQCLERGDDGENLAKAGIIISLVVMLVSFFVGLACAVSV